MMYSRTWRLKLVVYSSRDRSGDKSGMTPPLRRRGLGTGQTSQTSLLLFRLLPHHLHEHRIHSAFDSPVTMSLLGKKFPGAMGMCFWDTSFSSQEYDIRTQRLTLLFPHSQASDSLLRCRYAYILDSEITYFFCNEWVVDSEFRPPEAVTGGTLH